MTTGRTSLQRRVTALDGTNFHLGRRWMVSFFLLISSVSAFVIPGKSEVSTRGMILRKVPEQTTLLVSTTPEDQETVTRSNDQASSLPVQSSIQKEDTFLPSVEFIDPQTGCQVVLLGCFHGTESSARDVERAVTANTDIVALELCTSRFSDVQRELAKEEFTVQQRPWIVAYADMIQKTVTTRGLPTGLAAAVLGGFSGIQTALSGFTPGLEFTTALELSEKYQCDVILADQDVDETLRRVGSIPQVALETALSPNRLDRWGQYHETLVRAVFGREHTSMPQVQLPLVLIRNPDSIQDLVRLTIPPTLFFWAIVYGMASLAGIDVTANQAFYDTATFPEQVMHWMSSSAILLGGYLGLALPAVGVVLTERDEILTTGIQAACQRAGQGGRVVAVLGLLHVNGVAKRMLASTEAVP